MIKTYDLCTEVLRRLQDTGILESIIVVGSWCIYFLDASRTIKLKQIKRKSLEEIFHLTLLMSCISLQNGNNKFIYYERFVYET